MEWGGGRVPFNYRKKISPTHVSKATGIRMKSRSGHRSVGGGSTPCSGLGSSALDHLWDEGGSEGFKSFSLGD